jgi:predicted dienelactone hydrolase
VREVKPFLTAGPDSPYRIGVMIEWLEFEGRDMRVVIWYPALEVEGVKAHVFRHDEIKSIVMGSAVLDAPPDRSGAPYPLIVYSPGLTGPADASVFYTQNLASHGYVVIGIDHLDAAQWDLLVREGNWKNLLHFFPRILKEFMVGNPSDTVLVSFTSHFRRTEFGLKYRPAEVSLVFDKAAAWNQDASHALAGMLDPDNIGMTGHSLGAWTSLLFGGMSLKYDAGLCASDFDINRGCIADLDPCCTRSARFLEDPFALRDERVKAMLPLGSPIFHHDAPDNAREIKVPLMFLTGDDKRWEATVYRQKEVYDSAPDPKYFVVIKDTDHFVICDMLLASPYTRHLPRSKFRRHFQEKARVYKDYSVAFFDLYLKGDDARAGILQVPNQPFVKQVWHEGGII